MSQAFVVRESIPQPPDRVWRALTDWEQAPRWMGGIESMSVDGPTAVGARVTFVARGKERGAELVEIEEGRVMVLRSVQGNVTADYRYELVPSPEGTDVTLTAVCSIRGWMAVLGPVLRFAMRRADGGQLAALRDVVDG